jgi:hypothetical protein
VSVDVDSVAAMTDGPAIKAIDLVKKFGGAPTRDRPSTA